VVQGDRPRLLAIKLPKYVTESLGEDRWKFVVIVILICIYLFMR
jgi:hypothetical protein